MNHKKHHAFYKHIAVLINNNNEIIGKMCINDKSHAEINVIFQSHLKTNKKLSLLIIRFNNSKQIISSKPCKYCLIQIIKCKFIKNIIYSNESGELIKESVQSIESNHISKKFRNKK